MIAGRHAPKPVVAIVGRPNVGKSTLFNRLVGRQSAIVSDVAGTTRDRVTSEVEWAGRVFILVDTGGLEPFPETDLWRQIRAQIDIAIADADIIVMLADATTGATPADHDAADMLRRTAKPVVLAANKCDNPERTASAVELYELGLGEPTAISAYHNSGVDDLMGRVVELFPSGEEVPEPSADVRLAIVGRTNVGKSALLNAITESDRAIVSDVPGTTRDSLDTLVSRGDRSVLLIDTAGIRRRGKIGLGIERYSVLRSVRAIDRADVAAVVTDASELGASQDAHVAGYVLESYKGVVIVVNKWDLSREAELTRERATEIIRARFAFARYAPVCFTSALRRTGLDNLLNTVEEVHRQWTKGLPRYDLSRTVMNAVADHPPSPTGRRSLKVYGVTQDQTGPPSFTFYVNRSDMVHYSYRRYLENRIRAAYDFTGSPLKMRFKGRGES